MNVLFGLSDTTDFIYSIFHLFFFYLFLLVCKIVNNFNYVYNSKFKMINSISLVLKMEHNKYFMPYFYMFDISIKCSEIQFDDRF